MIIEKRIKLNPNIYYIVINVEYKIKNDIPVLCLQNYKEDYWDGGDCSLLINKIENEYTKEQAQKYDSNISFMADVIYIYDRMPFISGIKDVYIASEDNLPYSIGYIKKEEIDKYIIDNKIEISNYHNFKLYDERTWK